MHWFVVVRQNESGFFDTRTAVFRLTEALILAFSQLWWLPDESKRTRALLKLIFSTRFYSASRTIDPFIMAQWNSASITLHTWNAIFNFHCIDFLEIFHWHVLHNIQDIFVMCADRWGKKIHWLNLLFKIIYSLLLLFAQTRFRYPLKPCKCFKKIDKLKA